MLAGRQAQHIVTADAIDGGNTQKTPAAAGLSTSAEGATSPDGCEGAGNEGGFTRVQASLHGVVNAKGATRPDGVGAGSREGGGFARVQASLQGLARARVAKLWRLLGGRQLQKWPADKREYVITVLQCCNRRNWDFCRVWLQSLVAAGSMECSP